MFRKTFTALFAAAIVVSLGLSQESSTDSPRSPISLQPSLRSADWVNNAVIYCVYLRSFSPEGTFRGLEERIPELSDLGVNVIWLMPIHPVGIKNRKGTLGSPYSVRDYYATNPEFGSIVDFQKLLETVHRHRMRLILDLVINHTSWDSKLIGQHPEWFTTDSLGRILSPNDDWTDVADLDYSKPGLQKYMLEMMEWWVKDIGIDGFRCDVSELVPLDFWEEARNRLRAIKPVIMLSEGSLPEHHLRAFDITYSWNIYDALEPLLTGEQPASLIDSLLKKEKNEFPQNALRLRFNTNHDKNAWDAPAIRKFGSDGLKLSAVLVNTIPGIPMLYNGEEVANDKPLGLFEKVDIGWSRPREMDTLYRTLFKLRKDHKAIARGKLVKLPTPDDTVLYAFLRTEGSDNVLVVLNFSGQPRSPSITISDKAFFGRRSRVRLKELFTHSAVTVENGRAFPLSVGPHGYRVYVDSDK